ncbi:MULTISPECIES: aspartate/glutamate racemase family protein [unclassified Marinobacter]|jgi:maleate isomerase|uniref:maleate cis-trans isomerase family protein n=1 Tax=unclassified Marinobacter TaxID=83889 RepID=UPI00200E8330|nr:MULTISPECIES: aspartate/glutamate racemase family protein [unclassified Marinobacter]MCL1483741.1 aspartate/glutamate racemase family protein [Marinobacter sp.]UQG55332.1 aspartate/glutamate racemase family protein [Marinobacter sp. M4C]UQG64135.1 aspartate/glutamate racemase family protein [Marinobacter sp. M2C]UQG68419.1 aspartate/glutamate racemase family protein [Marinobacter sp. M1C]
MNDLMKSDRRIRVALLVPSSNTVMENDLHSALPKDHYTVHTDRMYLTETTREKELEMIERYAPQAASDLATLAPDVLVFGCTSAGSLFGLDYDARICRELGENASCAGMGVISAVAEALDEQPGKRLAVITPYNQDLTQSVAKAALGNRELVCAHGMGITDNRALADPTPADIVAFAKDKLAGEHFDVLFVSCTNFRAVEAREALQKMFGVPVVTSNSAVIDALLKLEK